MKHKEAVASRTQRKKIRQNHLQKAVTKDGVVKPKI